MLAGSFGLRGEIYRLRLQSFLEGPAEGLPRMADGSIDLEAVAALGDRPAE